MFDFGNDCPDDRPAPRKKNRKKPDRIRTIWDGMKSRCLCPTNPLFAYYGGRGITICQEWIGSSRPFIEWGHRSGYDDILTLDRIDNDGNYDPGNCRWVDMKIQALNRRSAFMITAFGETKNCSLWEEDSRSAVGRVIITKRLRRGWHPEDAIVTPPRGKGDREQAIRAAIREQSNGLWPSEIAEEVWKPIPISSGYEGSDMGRVRSYRKGGGPNLMRESPVILKPYREPDGRLNVSIVGGGKRKVIRVPILILMAHVGLPEPGQLACHFPDPNPGNCRLSNLYWGSYSDNQRDKTRVREILFSPS